MRPLLRIALWLLFATFAPLARAQADVPLRVELDGVADPDARAALRAAIEHELRRPIELVDNAPDGKRTLIVSVSDDHATLVYRRPGAAPLDRAVELPRDEARRIEIVALLSGNLVRNEAEELVEELRRRAAERDAASKAAPAPTTETASAATETASPKPPEPPKAVEAPSTPPPARRKPVRESKRPAPADDLIESANFGYDLSLWYPAALFRDSDRRRLNLEIGLGFSHVGAIEGLGVNLLLMRVERDVHGVIYATAWNDVGTDTMGAQLTFLVNRGGGNLRGADVSAVANLRYGKVEGVQAMALFNRAADVKGAQVGGINVASNLIGAQAGAVNLAGDGSIAQGGAINVAGDVAGVQVGAANLARDLDGVQIAAVNIAGRVRGAQIGVVNVSDEIDGVPLGVANVTKKGHVRGVVWADPRFPVSGGIRFEPNFLVTTLAGAYSPARHAYAAEAGMGARLELGPFFGDIDALYAFEHLESGTHRHGIRYAASAGLRIVRYLGVFAGAGVWQTLDASGVAETSDEYHAGIELF